MEHEQARAWLRQKSQAEPYARHLGMEVVEVGEGQAQVAMDFTPQMTNVFGMMHGGAVFSLLDEAFQLACNSQGEMTVALQISIHYLAPAQPGARLIAQVREINSTRKTALYQAEVRQADGMRIATGQALAYRKGRPLPLDEGQQGV